MWSDNPVKDFLEWDAYQETRQAMWEAACVRCEICHKRIDPDEDPNALRYGDDWIHIECFNKKVTKSDLPDDLKDYIIESVEEANYDYTPVPEGI